MNQALYHSLKMEDKADDKSMVMMVSAPSHRPDKCWILLDAALVPQARGRLGSVIFGIQILKLSG